MTTIQVKRVELSKQFRDKIQYRLVHKEGMSRHDAKQAVEQMLEYLATSTSESPTLLADQAWHNAILCTREYADFCQENFGRFVHHVPRWPPKESHAQADCGICNGNCQGCSKH